jgi:thiol-disulfide isomerase/thioredoxin
LLALLNVGCNSANPFRSAKQPAIENAPSVADNNPAANDPASLSLSDSADTLPDYLQTAAAAPTLDSSNRVTPASSTAPVEPTTAPNKNTNTLTSTARKTFDTLLAPLSAGSRSNNESIAAEIAAFKPFPFTFELPNVAGEKVSSKSFGGQLMLVDVWATWCGPCKAAIPELVEIQNEFQSLGVEIVGITCDSDDPEEAAAVARKAYNIGKQLQVNYPLLVDNGSTIPQIPGFRGYPTMLFLTPDGQVRYMVTGVQSREKLVAMINTVLQM